MHVVVLGAGIVGMTSAYSLAMRGFEVTVVDRADAVAAGASYANGGQLSYSFTDALARPSFLPGIPGLLLGRDPAIRVRLLTRPWLPGWGMRFLRQCTHKQARNNTVAVLELAMRSASRMAMISELTGVSFAHRKDGKLVLLPEGADLDVSRQTISLKKRHGCDTEMLSMAEAIALEPAVEAMTGRYAAALYSAKDETGDARAFTEGLAAWLQRHKGVTLRLQE
ncbi:MAG: FAD-dependent oxidoreductase, partial [Woeseia sp.]